MKLDYVVLVVDDLDASLAFYVDRLGFPIGHRSGPYAQLETGATRLGLFERGAMAETLGRELEPPRHDAPAFELGCKVEDCDVAYAALVDAGVEPVTLPTDRAWGQRTAYVQDPDGHLVELAHDLPEVSVDHPRGA